MSASYSNAQPERQTHKGMAIASLALGIISIPTLGLLVVGAVMGIILGAIALKNINQDPANHGGKGAAIAGIVTSAISLGLVAIIGVLAAIAVPKLNDSIKHGRETAAVNSLRIIHNSQMQFRQVNLRFASLEELAESELLDQTYAGGDAISGYVYLSSSVSSGTYCVHAERASGAVGYRDFIICEDGIIRFVASEAPAIVRRGEGKPLDSSFYYR